MTPSAISARAERRGAIALALLLAGLHLGLLSLHSLHNNEFITLRSIRLDWGEMLRERIRFNHMPGYFALLKAWVALAGESEIALRLPSAAMTLAGLFFLWRLARWLFGAQGGMLAAALAGLCNVHLYLSSDARMYSGIFMCASISLWAVVRYLDDARKSRLAWLFAAGCVGMLMQPIYFLATLSLCLYAALTRPWPWEGRRGPLLAAALAPTLLLSPLLVWWALAQHKIGPALPWNGFKLNAALRQVIELAFGDSIFLDNSLPKYAGLAAFGAAWIALWRRPAPAPRFGAYGKLIAIWIALPTAAIVLAGMRATPQLVNDWRYYIVVAPALPLLMTWTVLAIAERNRRAAAALIAVALCAVAVNSAAYLLHPDSGLREAAQYLKEHRMPGEPMLASAERARTLAFEYYGLEDSPTDRPRGATDRAQILHWILEATRAPKKENSSAPRRFWVVFYQDLDRDKVRRVLEENKESFKPEGPPFAAGWTSVQAYLLP